jgi:arylsulfatase A-like enzyme
MDISSAAQVAAVRPNILLIIMDAARARNLSCYGYHRPTTPNLERFAERCVVYETAISPAGWSLPSHASIFTGLYPSHHGAHDQHKYLLPEYPTMAELLRSQGYHTLAICHNAYVSRTTGLDRGFEKFNPVVEKLPRRLRKIKRKAESGVAALLGRRDNGARLINKRAIAALRRLQTEERPFFMFTHYLEPHAPYRPPRKYNRYLPRGTSAREANRINQDRVKYLADLVTMYEQDFKILTDLYDGEITYLDTRINQVLSWLEESGMLDQTMVIITADHGENVGDHQLMGHTYCLYDTLLHVPLIIHYPKGITAPGRVEHQVQTLDLLPTILSILGDTSSETYRSLQGHDLLSSTKHDYTIAEQANPDLTAFYKRFPDVDVSRYDRALKMIRTDRHKYIWCSDGKHELYDLKADPDEESNIISENPDIAKVLDRRLTEWRNSFEAALPLDQVPEFDEAVKARLRALGYLE